MRFPGRILLGVISALVLANVPAAGGQAPAIPERDRIRLAEAFRLGEELQDKVWPGWSQAPFAVLLVTPEWEFLLRHPKPSEDFKPAGYDPLLKTEVNYRKRVFPTHFLATFPAVNGIATIVVGQAENTDAKEPTRWVVTLLHEHFHQLQDSQPDFFSAMNALGLSRGDQTGMWMLNFPFPYGDAELGRRFSALCGLLADATDARGTSEFTGNLAAFRAARKGFAESLSVDDYKYLSFQLWKEGVARYIEYRVARLAAERFQPSVEFRTLPGFRSFAEDATATLARIQQELKSMNLATMQRVAFYPVGAAEALLLDATNSQWKERYFVDKFFLARIPDK